MKSVRKEIVKYLFKNKDDGKIFVMVKNQKNTITPRMIGEAEIPLLYYRWIKMRDEMQAFFLFSVIVVYYLFDNQSQGALNMNR